MFASDGDYLPGEKIGAYCAERAKGGAGLIEVSLGIVGDDTTSPNAPTAEAHFFPVNMGNPMILSGRWPIKAGDNRVIEGYARLAKSVHEYGAKCFIELVSIGSNLGQLKGVSSFPWPGNMPFTPREMDENRNRT